MIVDQTQQLWVVGCKTAKPNGPKVYGCTQLWKRAGVEVLNFGMWPLSLQLAERGVSGHNEGQGSMQHKGNRHKLGSARGSRGFHGPLGIPLGHLRRWCRFDTLF